MTLTRIIDKLIRFAGVASLGESLQALDARFQPYPARKAGSARIIILGRQHYFETRKTYPVHTLKELRAAISLDAPELSPWPAAQPVYQVVSRQPGQMRVNIWFPNPAIAARLAKAWLVIPESLLIARASCNRLLHIQAPQPWFLYTSESGLITSQQAKGLYADQNVFAGLTPLDADQMHVVPQREIWSFYHQGILKLSSQDIAGLWVAQQRLALPDAARLKTLSTLAAALFIVYTGASSAWLVYTKNQLEQAVSSTRANTDAELALESELEQMAARHTQLSQALTTGTSSALALAVYPHFSGQVSQLQRLGFTGQQVELSVVTPSATDLLETLSDNPAITRVSFSGPVQGNRRGNGDQATLVFGLRPTAKSLTTADNIGEAGNG